MGPDYSERDKTRVTDKPGSRSDAAALLELAATWCDGQVRGAYGATANEWFHRAAQLRAGAVAVAEYERQCDTPSPNERNSGG